MGMGVSSVSSSAVSSGAALHQQQRQNFNQLSQALQSGNLDAAKQAFSAITAKSSNAIDPNSPLGKLGAALQSGDVKAAQDAFAALKSSRHHHGAGNQTAAVSSSAPATPLATSGSVGTNVNTVV